MERVFLCQDGFGLLPSTYGRAIFGVFVANGKGNRVEGHEVERFATDDEVKEAQEHWDQFHRPEAERQQLEEEASDKALEDHAAACERDDERLSEP